jgi:hypothetical protein
LYFRLPLTGNIVFSSIQNSGQWSEPRNPVTASVIHHGQNPLEPEKKTRYKITREVNELVLATRANDQATA